MSFLERFRKKPTEYKTDETVYKKKYTVCEMDEIGNMFYDEVIKKIGKGEFKIGYNLCKHPEFYAELHLDKNTPMYNSLFRDLFWSRDTSFRRFARKHDEYENMIFNLKREGFVEICKEIARDHNITVEITEWSVENIIISYDEKVWSSWSDCYIYTNKKTLADLGREKCFAW